MQLRLQRAATREIGFQYNLNELWGHPATATDIASGDVPANAHSLSFESAQGEFVRENFEAGKRSSKLRSEREPEKADYPATDLDLRAAQAGAIHHDQF
jgi:hypothetical protein